MRDYRPLYSSTISLKITPEIEVRKYIFASYFADELVSALLGICSFIVVKCVQVGLLLSIARFFSSKTPLNWRFIRLDQRSPVEFSWKKELNQRIFTRFT